LSRDLCWHAVLLPGAKISLKSDNRLMSYGQKTAIFKMVVKKILFFGHETIIEFNICYSVPNFIKKSDDF